MFSNEEGISVDPVYFLTCSPRNDLPDTPELLHDVAGLCPSTIAAPGYVLTLDDSPAVPIRTAEITIVVEIYYLR